MCDISRSRENLDLNRNSYASVADGGAKSVMALQAHTGVKVLITINTAEDALPRCCFVVFLLSSTLLLVGKPLFKPSVLQMRFSMSDC